MRNVTPSIAPSILAALLFLAGLLPAAADPPPHLLGDWCDETGYRVELRADGVSFFDAQAPHPPPGAELAIVGELAVYTQDFRGTPWPQLDVVACRLSLTGPDRALETCTGPGVGFRPVIPLKRCSATPIS